MPVFAVLRSPAHHRGPAKDAAKARGLPVEPGHRLSEKSANVLIQLVFIDWPTDCFGNGHMASQLRKQMSAHRAIKIKMSGMPGQGGGLFERSADVCPPLGIGAARPRRASQTMLLKRALATAAELQQRVSEQQARIAYLEKLSVTDELTGLFNRRGFKEHLGRCLATARRYGGQGVLALCDLDSFKRVNDSLGHAIGDDVLRQVGHILRDNVRDTDIVARLGGDEFAILMMQTTWRDGYKRAQILERLLNSSIIKSSGHHLAVRASFGAIGFGPDDDERALIERTDIAMYGNKRKKAAIAFARIAAE